MDNLNELRKIAEEATPGPWVYGDNRDGLGNKLHPAKFPGKYNPIADFEYTEDEDAEHISTFDPPAILALLTRLEQAEAAVARVRELAEAWKSRGEHDMDYSKTIPEDIGEIINEGGAEMVNKANLIYRALDGER